MKPISTQSGAGDVMVVMLHDVIKERTRKSEWFDCTEANLRAIIEWVVINDGKFLTMDELYEHLTEGKPVPPKSVVLTFDDNYQGVYDWAVPVMDEYQVPFTVFVHTDYVGQTTGHPKMTWDELKELVKDHRATVASHTASHPDDFTKLTGPEQLADLQKAFDSIEANMGFKTPYLAYANGKYDHDTLNAAEATGCRMAFIMESGAAEESASILEVARVPFHKFFDYWDVMEAQRSLQFPVVSGSLASADIREEEATVRRERFVAITGGEPKSVLGSHRKTVPEFMRETGAQAGVNGGFFALAAVAADDNQMMGPCKTANTGVFTPSKPEYNVSRLRRRPLVVWGRGRFVLAPYSPGEHNREDAVEKLLPGFTDCFLAGAWLVVDGQPLTGDQILAHGAQDAEDPRRRAFLGFRADGTLVCGASLGSVPSSVAAKAAIALGCRTAILLDSGFSTSLVLGNEVLASGHSTKTKPSRPVPHAIMIVGTVSADAHRPVVADSPEPEVPVREPKPSTRRKSEAAAPDPAGQPSLPPTPPTEGKTTGG